MNEVFRNQVLQELRHAGYHGAIMAEDGKAIVPIPEYPNLLITETGIRYSQDASLEERDLGHNQMLRIWERAHEATMLWQNSRVLTASGLAEEKYHLFSEYGNTLLAARNDGAHGLHFVTWEYDYDRTGVHHGHYTTSYANAKEDFGVRAGLVDERQLLKFGDMALLYRALKYMGNHDQTLTESQRHKVARLCDDIEQIDEESSHKVGLDVSDGQEPADLSEQEFGM